ncbi:glycosyltransferase family 25 protein [Aquamicrobium sp. LC103]|uniref:glycosyltransferase family 25 protein n=1 Tax=Aquamicrobium sp. LC103 TaxID=1120658 RepID=UPI0024849883|nr:glycosyltransferase family 25 protein [Aquamicrobium sp. LC103]
MRTLLINLDASIERLRRMEEALGAAGITFERVSAVDARQWPREDMDVWIGANCPRYPMGGELGCYLSHRRCWEFIAEGEDEFALVLEDDVVLSALAGAVLRDPRLLIPGADLIRLESWSMKVWVDRRDGIKLASGHEVKRLRSGIIGAAAYVLSRRGAQKLLELSPRYSHPVDLLIYFELVERCNMWTLVPSVFTQLRHIDDAISAGPFVSTISPTFHKERKSLKQRVASECRNLYRRLVRTAMGQQRARGDAEIFVEANRETA